MRRNKIISALTSAFLIAGILSTSSVAARAAEINNKTVTQVSQEFNLKPVDKAPENAKILKFNTPDQAEKFLKVLKANEKNGNILDISSLVSSNEIDNKIIDLSDKEITGDNFTEVNLSEPIPAHNRSTRSYDTSRAQSISINGIAKLTARCSMRIEWSQNKGNHIASIRSVTSTFTGLTLGNAWTQTGYDANISNDGKSVRVTVYGKYDYYILINTSLTSFAGENEDYTFTFEY